jgi:predicted RNase H-like nuclease (RuvC/YqgF family)
MPTRLLPNKKEKRIMFKKFFEKLVAKAVQAEREKYEAELETVKNENRQLNERLCSAEKAQSAMQQKNAALEQTVTALRKGNSELNQTIADLRQKNSELNQDNNELEDKLGDTSWQLAMAEEKIEDLRQANTLDGKNKFAAAKAMTFFTALAQKPTEELRKMPCNYEVVFFAEKWSVVTGYCSHCGSNICKTFCDERTALLYALFGTAFGQSPKEGLCARCHAEYMNGGF